MTRLISGAMSTGFDLEHSGGERVAAFAGLYERDRAGCRDGSAHFAYRRHSSESINKNS